MQTVGILLCAVFLSSAANGQTAARAASVEVWRQFRAAQPFQTQVVAMSQASGGEPRTLIVSEPAPQVTQASLTALLGAHAAGCETREWAVMSGGTVSDVVCTVVGTDLPGWADALARIQIDALGSTEGAPIISLPVTARKMLAHSLDVKFAAKDLHGWVVNGKQRFSSNPIAPSVALNDLLNGGVRGVFKSDDGSLVIWVVNRDASLDQQSRGDIHRFAAGGDLVLGAIANKQAVVIVGRARAEPLAHLPPLRSETVLLLAGSGESELKQSYERNDMIAGRGLDGIDRAPILLSPQLVDTEFGTLLNIADQLLKGWSLADYVRYADFNYPKPPTYPFGATPERIVNNNRETFLFNWNTDGAAYLQTIEGLDVITPQRTGSLSVIYGDANDRPRDMEETAYNYFARSGDTTLARVVQYSLLYQIFRQFGITAARPPEATRYKEFTANLNRVTRAQFKFLLNDMSESQLRTQLSIYWTNYATGVSDADFASRGIRRDEFIAERVEEAMGYAQALSNANRISEGEVLNALVDVVATFRLRSKPTSEEDVRFDAALDTLLEAMEPELVLKLLQDRGLELRHTGLIQVAMSQSAGWDYLMSVESSTSTNTRTSYVVESHTLGIVSSGVGGHNIDASMTRFQADRSLAKGQIKVNRAKDGSWVVEHSPADSGRLGTIAREIGTRRNLSKEQIETDVTQALKTGRAEAPVTLSSIRQTGGRAEEFKPTNAAEASHIIRPLNASEAQTLAELAINRQDAIIMEQVASGAFTLTRTGSANALQVRSVTAATDALANGLIGTASGRGGVSILIKGIAEEKAEAMLSYVQASLRRRSKDYVDDILASGSDLFSVGQRVRLLNEKIAHNGLRLDRSGIKLTPMKGGDFDGFMRVQVPITVQAKTPWHLWIVFFVKDFSAAAVEAISTKVTTILASLKGPASPVDIQLAIRRGLQNDLRELNVDRVLLHLDSDATQKIHRVIIAQDDETATIVRAS
ncbi:hypothetical protein A3839_03550 [Achromobacter insolitus]|nr:hypothetical protein A3839_03550 [Achromobacter insolitus]